MPEDLELDPVGRRRLADAALSYAEDYLNALPGTPASYPPITPDLIARLAVPPAEEGRQLPHLLELLSRALESGIDTSSGKFLSYIPSGGIYSAAIGRLLGAVTNRYTGGTHGAPGLIAIEAGVVRWMCRLFGLPDTSSGILLSGGSVANLTATVAARSRLGDEFAHGVVYTSERAHHSVTKAARIAGVHPDRIRIIAADASLRLDTGLLEETIAADGAAGLTPMMIAVSAGTTDTGTVDPLTECARIAESVGAWFHVDAAYGGFFVLTERGRARLAGIEMADSITVDAHKSLFMPFGIGGLLVRDESQLVDSLEGRGSYMQDVPEHGREAPNYFAMGPELTRPPRGLEVWLALNLHGVESFRAELDRMLDLTAWTAQRLADMPEIEVIADPELSIVAFRSTAGDATTRAIAQHMNDSGEVHVSSTTVDERFIVRLAFLSQRTTADVARRAVELIREASPTSQNTSQHETSH
jgi:aromatic-L-amino-acid decarboxylase